MRRLKEKRGQSTVEYSIVFAAIAAAIIFAAATFITPAVNETLNAAADGIQRGADYFRGNIIGFGKL